VSIRDLPRWLLPAVVGAAAVVVLIIVVAGGGDDDVADGPAAVVPADAPLYVDVSLRPEGDAKESADAALGAILDTPDPGAKLLDLVEQKAKEQGDEFDYEADVAPWLGEHFAVYLTKIGGDSSDSEGGFVIETSDPEKALDFVNSSQGDQEGESKQYEGVTYTLESDGDAFGLVGEFLVGGDEEAFKAAVNANRGDSLAESGQFNDSLGGLDSDRLATLYVPIKQFLDSVADTQLGPQERNVIEGALGDAADEPVLGQMTASATDVTFELSAGGGGVQTEESSLLDDLPADTWLALGFGDVGGAIEQGIDSFDNAGIGAEAIQAQVKAQTGLELDAVTAALGEAAVFVNGSTVGDLGGALIVQDKDETVTANLLDRLSGLIKQQSQGTVVVKPLKGAGAGFQLTDPAGQLKQPIQVVQASGKIVAGYGASSVQQASNTATSAKTLSEEPAFMNARDAVGDLGVDAFVAIEPILSVAESAGAGSDPGYQQAKPYLQGISFIAVGSGSDADRSRVRFVFGLG
jgi:hypothetical protein